MTRYSFFSFILLLLITGLACSGSGSPAGPVLDNNALNSITDGRTIWGTFDLAIDTVDGTAKVVWNREAQVHLNVTNFISPPNCSDCVQVVGFTKDATIKRAYVELIFRNPTNLTGYDVRAVISNPGGSKVLVNADGITEVWGTPMQFRAINVNPGRAFGPQQAHGRMFDFYLPDGEKFVTLTYIVDASYPTNVLEPLIENGAAAPLTNNGFATTTLTAKVFDHQSDLVASQIYADLSQMGGSPQTQMFDDGAHADGPAGDGVFGTAPFSATNDPGYYMVNIFAGDTNGHTSWGQGLVPVQDGGTSGNDDPIIDSVDTNKTTAKGPSESIQITVEAHDPNGDPLSYEFEAESGTFTGQNDNEVSWKPSTSQTGSQIITVTVFDDNGGFDQQDIQLISTTYAIIPGNTGGKLPSATLTSLEPSDSISLPADVAGKVLYLNFWATWCGPCIAEMPHLSAMYNEYKDNPDYVHIECSTGETSSTVQNWLNSNSYGATYWTLDSNSQFYSSTLPFGNGGYIPWHLVFDRDGYCRWVKVGGVSSTQEIKNVLDQLL
jgi:thiol-disulfide isomerase/thioredoxin